MRLLELILGSVLLLGSTYGYFHSSNLIVQIQNDIAGSVPQFFPKITEEDSNSNLLRINHPTMVKMIIVTQYGFVILAVSGLALLGYGVIAKRQTSHPTEKFPN